MEREDVREVLALIAPLRRKLSLVASRCVAAIVRDTTQTQNVQAENLGDEAFDQLEHMQPGGLTHVPLAGAEGVRITMAGVYDDSVVVALSNRDARPTGLGAGETALYNAGATQSTVVLRANGDVEVTLAAGARLLMGDGTQSFIRGEDFVTYLNAVIAATGTAISGVPGNGAALKTAFDSAIAAAVPLRTAALSVVIKGE